MTATRNRLASFVLWLRKTHGWIGLWGASLGLLFGVSGILLNHRAVIHLPDSRPERSLQLEVSGAPPESPQALGIWLQEALSFDRPPTRVRVEPARAVPWGERDVTQPAHWIVTFLTPYESAQADWWVGNRFVTVRRTQASFPGLLTNLHKGTGLSLGWTLLTDTLAGGLILLSLTGVTLWILVRRHWWAGAAVAGASLAAMVVLAVWAV